MVQVGVVEKRLGGNAADVETSAAECAALLDTGDLRPGELVSEGGLAPVSGRVRESKPCSKFARNFQREAV